MFVFFYTHVRKIQKNLYTTDTQHFHTFSSPSLYRFLSLVSFQFPPFIINVKTVVSSFARFREEKKPKIKSMATVSLHFFFFFFSPSLLCFVLLSGVSFAADPFVSYDFKVSYLTASPLGVPQQVWLETSALYFLPPPPEISDSVS